MQAPASSTTVANTAPSAPLNFSAATSSNTVSLSWSAPATTGGTITGYKIYRGTAPGKYNLIKTTNGSTLSYVDGNKVNGTTYYYVISALNAIGESPLSAAIRAIPQ
ncbi:fibronectin type III domain-containing protein [Danxiaibacter flavus]|uniref:Fibronectin type III domain-containing protein n=1 Tax=Danxiaibacter flavus TaxID=3049108 RepID=A0ABV3ZHH4_9BACT|nr:fibronectin type III domain-containing protein [Chitinophagaceae bacterium DXS]